MGLRVVYGNGGNSGGSGNGDGHRYDAEPYRETPALVRHLQRLMGRPVELATVCGRLSGRLLAVAPDHVVLQVNGRRLHVSLRHLCWASEEAE